MRKFLCTIGCHDWHTYTWNKVNMKIKPETKYLPALYREASREESICRYCGKERVKTFFEVDYLPLM